MSDSDGGIVTDIAEWTEGDAHVRLIDRHVVCESVACDAASSDDVDSARAVADPATQSAKAAMSGRISFEDTVDSFGVVFVG